MNTAIVFTIHGSIEEIEKKVEGDWSRVSEFLILQKYAERSDKVFVFSDDRKDYSHLLPGNTRHIKLYNPIIYVSLGWLFLLFHALKARIKAVHLVGSPALPLVFTVNKLTGAKVVLDYNYLWYKSYIHDVGSGLRNRLRKNIIVAIFVKYLELFLVNNFVDHIMLGTEEAREIIKDEKKIMPIKKGIIIGDFNPEKTKPHRIFETIGKKSIVFTGRLVPMKDPLTLINAFNIVKKKIQDVSLIICGDGELLEECRKVSGEAVHFLGFVDDIPSILKGGDVYVQPSAYDPSPRSLLEAMAMGMPCIATRVGGVEQYLHNCGILIEPKNPQILAEEIIYLLENPDVARELGEKARAKMLKEHDLEENIGKELEIVVGS
jgi:glycosyltransferase involved in cell wall biosynthesis